MKYFYIYIFIINLTGFFVMFDDKQKAEKHKFRTPEAALFFVAAILGSPGILSGMYTFRHKTRHLKFVIGIPLILLVQLYISFKLFDINIIR